MSWGRVEPVSRIMLNSAATFMFLLVPLSDSLDPAFAGPSTVRVFATLSAAGKIYTIAWCKSSPQRCRALYHDYTMTVASTTVNARFNSTVVHRHGTGSSTAVPTDHVIFSTLDLMYSLDFIIFVLSLQVHMYAHMHP